MNYTYSEATGGVLGLNRSASELGETTGTCTPQDLIHGMEPKFYSSPEDTLIPKTQEEVAAIVAIDSKDSAMKEVSEAIELRKSEENLKDFLYLEELYKSDKDSIGATQQQALASVPADSILTLRGTPYEGMWSVIGSFVPYTNEEFLLFATEFFKRGSDNFTTRSIHLMNLEAIYLDDTKGAADILAYDYSTGWF